LLFEPQVSPQSLDLSRRERTCFAAQVQDPEIEVRWLYFEQSFNQVTEQIRTRKEARESALHRAAHPLGSQFT